MFPLVIAHILFWVFLAIGASDMGWRNVAIYAALWGVGYIGSAWVQGGGLIFVAYVAVLDVALVFHVFQGDVRL